MDFRNALVFIVVYFSAPHLSWAKCEFSKIPSSTDESDHIVYKTNDGTWTITVLSDSDISISNSRTAKTCKAQVDQVNSVFCGAGDTIVFESGNAAEDYLTFVNGSNCKLTRQSTSLSIDKKKRKTRLSSLKICE